MQGKKDLCYIALLGTQILTTTMEVTMESLKQTKNRNKMTQTQVWTYLQKNECSYNTVIVAYACL